MKLLCLLLLSPFVPGRALDTRNYWPVKSKHFLDTVRQACSFPR